MTRPIATPNQTAPGAFETNVSAHETGVEATDLALLDDYCGVRHRPLPQDLMCLVNK